MIKLNETFGTHQFTEQDYETLLPFMPNPDGLGGSSVDEIEIETATWVPCITMTPRWHEELINSLKCQGFEKADIDYSDDRVSRRGSHVTFFSRDSLIVSVMFVHTSPCEEDDVIFLIEQL